MKYTRLGDLLVGSGAITQQQLQQALAIQKENGKRLGDVLRDSHIITESQVIDALMAQLGLEFIDLNSASISSEMAQLVPKSLAKKHRVVPVRATRSELYLAMSDPLNFAAIEEVGAATRRQVIPMIATEEALERALQNLYSNQGTMKAIEDMRRDLDTNQYGSAVRMGEEFQLAADEEDENAAPLPSGWSTPSSSGPIQKRPATSIWSPWVRSCPSVCALTALCAISSPFPGNCRCR